MFDHPGLATEPRQEAGDNRVWRRRSIIAGATWFAAAFLFSLQAYIGSRLANHPQPWWPSFAYSCAIFSVWAVLSLPLVWFAERVEHEDGGLGKRLAAYMVGLVGANALHVLIFILVYWPVYGVSNGFTALDTFAGRMFAANWHTNILFYLLLIAPAAFAARRTIATAPPAIPMPEPVIRVRTKDGVRLVPAQDIRWIAAAGNYAELHTAEGVFLSDQNLGTLAGTLPAARFARIHRTAIVRLDEVREIRSLGRGDALLVLRDGTELRLSRRYRAAMSGWLDGRNAGPSR